MFVFASHLFLFLRKWSQQRWYIIYKFSQKEQISAVVVRDKINENNIADRYLKKEGEFALPRSFFSFVIMINSCILIDYVLCQQLKFIHPKNAYLFHWNCIIIDIFPCIISQLLAHCAQLQTNNRTNLSHFAESDIREQGRSGCFIFEIRMNGFFGENFWDYPQGSAIVVINMIRRAQWGKNGKIVQ